MTATLAIFYTFLIVHGRWNIALLHVSFVGLAYVCELIFYNQFTNGALEALGSQHYYGTFNYGYCLAIVGAYKLRSMWRERKQGLSGDGKSMFKWTQIKVVNYIYFFVTMYYLTAKTEGWYFKIHYIEYIRFYALITVRGIAYSTLHYFAHIYNGLWSIHKSHHYVETQEGGDGNTISIIEFSVAWIPLTNNVPISADITLRFLHVLGDFAVHFYRRGLYHHLHHLFHNTNMIIPVIGRNMYGRFFPREFMGEHYEAEMSENYDSYKPLFKIYAQENNDLMVLNKAMYSTYNRYMKAVQARKVYAEEE